MSHLFFKPSGSVLGDVIPFHDGNEFRLFYLRCWRDVEESGDGTPWYQVATRDFIHFDDHGEALPCGTAEEQDSTVCTGSVIEAENRYHIFYAGFNPGYPKKHRKAQGILHAVSDDLVHWMKIPGEILLTPDEGYEPDDWRDPFVFWNEEAREYWMLVTARLDRGPSRRRGCIALCTSSDLWHWDVKDPFWAPQQYHMIECPDLFRIGDWWYLVYSEFSDRNQTRYCMSRTMQGPWIAPKNDAFDGRGYYAAKTCSDGSNRYAFGWIASRNEFKDEGAWNWGGNLVVHRLEQDADGTLKVVIPSSVDGFFRNRLPLAIAPGLGRSSNTPDSVELDTRQSFACASLGTVPRDCRLEMDVVFDKECISCGVMLKTDEDLERSYYLRLEPSKQRVVFDKWPRPGDIPFLNGLERPLPLLPDTICHIRVLIEGTVGVLYANDEIALSFRMYEQKESGFGVFANGGRASFRNISLQD